jgi:hypothetical protein
LVRRLVADYGEELEFLVALAAGLGGEDQECLGLVGVDQALPVQFQRPQPGMLDAFGFAVGTDDGVLAPDLGELLAGRQQRVDEGGGARVLALAGVGSAQLCGHRPAVSGVLVCGIDQPRGGVGEPAVGQVALHPGVTGLVSDEREGEPVLGEGFTEVVHDLGGGVLHAVEDAQHAGVDVVATGDSLRGDVSGQAEEVVALVQGQAQAPGDGGEYLLGGVGAALLLDPAVVVGGHAAEGRDLLAAQAARPPAAAPGQADLLGLQGLAPGAQKVGEFGPAHTATPLSAVGRRGNRTRREPPACLTTSSWSAGFLADSSLAGRSPPPRTTCPWTRTLRVAGCGLDHGTLCPWLRRRGLATVGS